MLFHFPLEVIEKNFSMGSASLKGEKGRTVKKLQREKERAEEETNDAYVLIKRRTSQTVKAANFALSSSPMNAKQEQNTTNCDVNHNKQNRRKWNEKMKIAAFSLHTPLRVKATNERGLKKLKLNYRQGRSLLLLLLLLWHFQKATVA